MDLLYRYQQINSVVNVDNEAFARELIEKLNASAEQSNQYRQVYEKKIKLLEDKLAIANANAATVGGSSASFVTNLKHKLETKVTETYEYKELHGRYRRLAAEHCKLQADQAEIVHRSISQLEQTYQQSLTKLNQYVAELREQSERGVKEAYRARSENEMLRDENRRAELTISELVKSRDRAEQLVRESQALYAAQLSLRSSEHEGLRRTATTERGAQASLQPIGRISKQLQTRTQQQDDQPVQEAAGEVYQLRKELMMSQYYLEASYQQLAELYEMAEPFSELQSRAEACSALEEQLAQRTGQLVSHQREIMQLNRRIQELREEIISQKIMNAAANARNAQMPYLQEQIKLLAAACERQPTAQIDREALAKQAAEAQQLLAEIKDDDPEAAETLRCIITEANAALERSQAADGRPSADVWEEVARKAAKMQTAELLMHTLQLLRAIASKSAADVTVTVGVLLQQFSDDFIAISAAEQGKPVIGETDLQWLARGAAAAFSGLESADFAAQSENIVSYAQVDNVINYAQSESIANQPQQAENIPNYAQQAAICNSVGCILRNDVRKIEKMAPELELELKKESDDLRRLGRLQRYKRSQGLQRSEQAHETKYRFPLALAAFQRIRDSIYIIQQNNERSLAACAIQLARARKIYYNIASTTDALTNCVESSAAEFKAGVLAKSSVLLQRLSDGLADSYAENQQLRGCLAGLTMKRRLLNSQRAQ